MRSVLSKTCAMIALAAATGCGSHVVVNTAEAQTGRTFIATLQALPSPQRAAYAQAHPDGLKAVMQSRDKKLVADYFSAVRKGH
jgi:hypothetical protein